MSRAELEEGAPGGDGSVRNAGSPQVKDSRILREVDRIKAETATRKRKEKGFQGTTTTEKSPGRCRNIEMEKDVPRPWVQMELPQAEHGCAGGMWSPNRQMSLACGTLAGEVQTRHHVFAGTTVLW